MYETVPTVSTENCVAPSPERLYASASPSGSDADTEPRLTGPGVFSAKSNQYADRSKSGPVFVGSSSSTVTVTVALRPAYSGAPEAVCVTVAKPSAASPSCTPVTVTVRAVFQFAVVNARLAGLTVAAAVLPLATVTVTAAEGCSASRTVYVSVAPSPTVRAVADNVKPGLRNVYVPLWVAEAWLPLVSASVATFSATETL